jgi:hypothetical protein
MNLRDLISTLESHPQDLIVREGFRNPHSYRGYYSELAFEPDENVAVRSMLDCARSALGATFVGWKGGEYLMHEYVTVYLANQGECGEELSGRWLRAMLEQALAKEGTNE